MFVGALGILHAHRAAVAEVRGQRLVDLRDAVRAGGERLRQLDALRIAEREQQLRAGEPRVNDAGEPRAGIDLALVELQHDAGQLRRRLHHDAGFALERRAVGQFRDREELVRAGLLQHRLRPCCPRRARRSTIFRFTGSKTGTLFQPSDCGLLRSFRGRAPGSRVLLGSPSSSSSQTRRAPRRRAGTHRAARRRSVVAGFSSALRPNGASATGDLLAGREQFLRRAHRHAAGRVRVELERAARAVLAAGVVGEHAARR